MSDVTRILQSIESGETKAAEELLPLVYEELRRLAAGRMTREAKGQTLQPTALVHEAWLRLAGTENPPAWKNRAHFFGAAAEAMRRILIDNARRKRAERHGGGQERVGMEEVDLAEQAEDDQLLEVHEALDELARVNGASADLVKLRYFVGMNMEEASTALGMPLRSAERLWTFARAWLRRAIGRSRG